MRDLSSKVENMEKKFQKMEQKEQKQAEDLENQPLDSALHMMPTCRSSRCSCPK